MTAAEMSCSCILKLYKPGEARGYRLRHEKGFGVYFRRELRPSSSTFVVRTHHALHWWLL